MFFFFLVFCIACNCPWQLTMFDKKQKCCVKCIHLVTDDGLYNRKFFYKVKIVFIHRVWMMAKASIIMFRTCSNLTLRNQNGINKVVLVSFLPTWDMLTRVPTISTGGNDHQANTIAKGIDPVNSLFN